jgi:thiol-disulfide isomerase/thioredoxin/uncharacterized membrane protein YphA (DoxX/SURF4 family)
MIDGLILTARLLLALTFLVAGAAKLADRPGAARALEEFGAPAKITPFLAAALPVLELVLGLGLLSVASVWLSAVGAFALLLLFTAAIAIAVARGRAPDCHCFGQLHSAPAGASTLIRNGVLAVVAGALAWVTMRHPGPSLLDAAASLGASRGLVPALLLVLVMAVVVQSILLYQLIGQQGRLLLRLEGQDGATPAAASDGPKTPMAERPAVGMPIGAPAPTFELQTLDGGSASLAQLLSSYGALLLIFTNPKCGPCSALAPEIAHWGLDESLPAKIVMISEGSVEDNVMKFGAHADPLVLLQDKRETADAYLAAGTPAAVLIGRDGRIASWVMFGADAIRDLVAESASLLRSSPEPVQALLPEPARRQPAGDLRLQDRNGAALPIDAFAGEPTLLLFWNPACGFCQKMEPSIGAWTARRPDGAPQVVAVITDPNAEPEAWPAGMTSLVDADGKVGAAFGARGTPMGILLDAQTRVASEIAAGEQAIFALLNGATRELSIQV